MSIAYPESCFSYVEGVCLRALSAVHQDNRVYTRNSNMVSSPVDISIQVPIVQYIIQNIIYFIVPPGYDQQGGYPPQQGGYPPQQQQYPPPTQGYGQPQGYAAPPQQQSSTNVVVVNAGGPSVQQTTIIQQPKERVNHILHLIITFFFAPWLFVWCILCCIYGC